MLEIAELNGETSDNSIGLAAAALIVSIARLAAIALVIPVAATPLKLAVAALRHSACKATGSRAASGAS
jgi:hypothetical protein